MANKVECSMKDRRGFGWYGYFDWLQFITLGTLRESLQINAEKVNLNVPEGWQSIGPLTSKEQASCALIQINNYAQHLKSYRALGKTPLSLSDWFKHCQQKTEERKVGERKS